jgi:hypothetical protein
VGKSLFSALACVFVLCGPLSAGTIAYYRFENNLSDSTGTPGHDGRVFDYGGANYAHYGSSTPVDPVPGTGAPNSASLATFSETMVFDYRFPFDTPGDATMEFWFNPTLTNQHQGLFWTTASGGDANRFNIFLDRDYPGGGYSLNIDYREPNGVLHPLFNFEYGGVRIPHPITASEWTFVALVRTGSTYSVYLNSDQTPAAIATDGAGANPAVNLPNNPGWDLDGWYRTPFLIDELRFSDSALRPDQFLNSDSAATPEPAALFPLCASLLGLMTLRRRAHTPARSREEPVERRATAE